MEQENIVTEYLEHNKAIEQSPEFQKIEQEVDNEVYRQFALERIQQEEKFLAEHGDYEEPDYEAEFGEEPSTSDGVLSMIQWNLLEVILNHMLLLSQNRHLFSG